MNEITKETFFDYIISYENGSLEERDIVKLFEYIAKNKLQYSLQGMYGRTLGRLQTNKVILEDGSANWDKVEELVNQN